MTTPLPADEQPEYGVPSSELTARAEAGFAKFLERADGEETQTEAEA
ncbi:hypothetical protein [Streptomyces purpureus]|nr:hypothetical protein [Streptomyces purpureus]